MIIANRWGGPSVRLDGFIPSVRAFAILSAPSPSVAFRTLQASMSRLLPSSFVCYPEARENNRTRRCAVRFWDVKRSRTKAWMSEKRKSASSIVVEQSDDVGCVGYRSDRMVMSENKGRVLRTRGKSVPDPDACGSVARVRVSFRSVRHRLVPSGYWSVGDRVVERIAGGGESARDRYAHVTLSQLAPCIPGNAYMT